MFWHGFSSKSFVLLVQKMQHEFVTDVDWGLCWTPALLHAEFIYLFQFSIYLFQFIYLSISVYSEKSSWTKWGWGSHVNVSLKREGRTLLNCKVCILPQKWTSWWSFLAFLGELCFHWGFILQGSIQKKAWHGIAGDCDETAREAQGRGFSSPILCVNIKLNKAKESHKRKYFKSSGHQNWMDFCWMLYQVMQCHSGKCVHVPGYHTCSNQLPPRAGAAPGGRE